MKTKFFYGIAALATLGLGACSSEEPVVDGNGVAQKDQTFFLKVALHDVNNGTRVANNSTNFEDGDNDLGENTIHNLQFKFYDASGTQIYQANKSDVMVDKPDGLPYPSVGVISTATIKVNVEQGQNMPAYVVCFANPVVWTGAPTQNPASGLSQMNDLRNLLREDYKATDGHFAMNNSVYFGTDPVSGAEGVKIVGAPIQKDQIFTSETAASGATDELNDDGTIKTKKVTDIYIERYAAKVKVSIANNSVTPSTYGGYTLTFSPENVGITADAANMYAVKRFSTQEGDNAPIPTQTQVQTALGSWNGWNDAPLHRSYWACSPAYYATSFPQVSDDIIDAAKDAATEANKATATGAGELVGNYKLKYYSYNQMTDGTSTNANANAKVISANGTTVHFYTMENTMGADAFASKNPKAAAPSVLLVGKTSLSANGTELPANTSFYIYDNSIYFDGSTVPTGALSGAKTIRNYMIELQSVLATSAAGAPLTEANAPTGLSVAHPSKATRAVTDVKLAENLVTLQVTPGFDATANPLFYKPMGSSQWTALSPTDQDAINYVNRQLAGQLNYANAYINGMSYYTIPIQHLRLSEDNNNNPIDPTTNLIDWDKVRVGDFGLVRNHVYNIEITGISGFGSGIFDANNPIVTSMDSYNYFIKYSLNVLNWRIVPKQSVTLN